MITVHLETIISAAVQQAVAPLNERIAALETQAAAAEAQLMAARDRIAALESAVDKATLAEFIEGEIIATLEFTDIVGEDRVARIESRLDALEGVDPAPSDDRNPQPGA